MDRNVFVVLVAFQLTLCHASYPLLGNATGLISDEILAADYMDYVDAQLLAANYHQELAQWSYNTNISDYTNEISINVSTEYSKFMKDTALTVRRYTFETFQNKTLRKMLRNLKNVGPGVLDDDEMQELLQLENKMEEIYSSAKVCVKGTCDLSLEPELSEMISQVGDYDQLLQVWKVWHDTVGMKEKPLFIRHLYLQNKSAVLNGYKDISEEWLEDYDTKNITDEFELLWQQVEPLYKLLHAYVREKLKLIYPGRMPKDGTIPAHLLGNMWAQSWTYLLDRITDYKGPSLDVTDAMKKQGWSVAQMVKAAESFFVSLGLEPMTADFWKNSLLVKPTDREVVCHASAWDFYHPPDFRIKACLDVKMEDLITIHHEMGHIQYFMLYSQQPAVFREGANEGFHEAIGDLMALSVSTPKHLRLLGLLPEIQETPESVAYFQLSMALEKLAFIPFGYMLDKWRWSVFRGETSVAEMNKKFWELRLKYQGVSPPVPRSEAHFDAGAKYHVISNVPYIRYFVSFIMQFQFHEALCRVAGQNGELHTCDIYNSTAAGDVLRKGLSLGSSKSWQSVCDILTQSRSMSSSSFLRYFQPLEEWLKKQLPQNTVIGWDAAKVEDYVSMAQVGSQARATGSLLLLICLLGLHYT